MMTILLSIDQLLIDLCELWTVNVRFTSIAIEGVIRKAQTDLVTCAFVMFQHVF